jgi:hypothetical protein
MAPHLSYGWEVGGRAIVLMHFFLRSSSQYARDRARALSSVHVASYINGAGSPACLVGGGESGGLAALLSLLRPLAQPPFSCFATGEPASTAAANSVAQPVAGVENDEAWAEEVSEKTR